VAACGDGVSKIGNGGECDCGGAGGGSRRCGLRDDALQRGWGEGAKQKLGSSKLPSGYCGGMVWLELLAPFAKPTTRYLPLCQCEEGVTGSTAARSDGCERISVLPSMQRAPSSS
jgi:hypothetical protein